MNKRERWCASGFWEAAPRWIGVGAVSCRANTWHQLTEGDPGGCQAVSGILTGNRQPSPGRGRQACRLAQPVADGPGPDPSVHG